jgi:hypothetical protein
MANTQTTVPAFVSSQVLTAQQMMQSAATGVPVFANTTTRDAGFGGAGEKTLAEGQLCYLESTNVVQYYDGAAWATLAPAPAASTGLTLITATTLSGSSTTVTSAFSATYDNYRIYIYDVINTNGAAHKFVLGSTTTNYEFTEMYCNNASAWTFASSSPNSSFQVSPANTVDQVSVIIDVSMPFLSRPTGFISMSTGYSTERDMTIGVQDSTTSFTSFTYSTTVGTFTGNVKVYGFANS